MLKNLLDTILLVLVAGISAVVFVLLLPLGMTRRERLRRGAVAMKRTDVQLLGAALLVVTYLFIVAMPAVLYAVWTVYWLCILYSPDTVYATSDFIQAWSGEKLHWFGDKARGATTKLRTKILEIKAKKVMEGTPPEGGVEIMTKALKEIEDLQKKSDNKPQA